MTQQNGAANVPDLSVPDIIYHIDHDAMPDAMPNVTPGYQDLADMLWRRFPPSAELSTALRKLLESKDAAMRCQRMVMESCNG